MVSGPEIKIRNLTVSREGREVVTDFTVDIPSGKTTALIGPNGAGKTSALLAILGILPYQGDVEYFRNGNRITNPRIGYVPQHINIDRGLPITVLDFMSLHVQKRPLWSGILKSTQVEVEGFLEPIGVKHLVNRQVGKLSGGEFQRVLLAKSLLREPEVLLLDEPGAGIDPAGEEPVGDRRESLQEKQGFTLLMVSHDLSIVSRHAHYVICMNREIHCAGETVSVLNEENLLKTFGPHMGLFEHDTHSGHHHRENGGHD